MPKLNPNSPLVQGILALSRRNYPHAFLAFRQFYHSPNWRQRDLAVTALGDLFDSRIIEQKKPPNSSLILGLEVPQINERYLSDQRLLVLLDTFVHPSLCRPRNMVEHKTVSALQTAQRFLQYILLNDPEYLVRFSTIVVLNDYFGNDRSHTILPAFQQALKQETNPDLKLLLEHFLAMTVQ